MAYDYLKDAEAITRRSFELVRAEAALDELPDHIAPLAERMVHACGLPEIVADLAWSGDVAGAAGAALRAGRPVLADARMVAVAVTALPEKNRVFCTLGDEATVARAEAQGTTRSAAAIEAWLPHLHGAIVAIGNAPTALFRLLELLEDGAPSPAVILAFPVGFVGAADSKEALIEADLGIPYLTLRGRFGGSALAAAAVNAIAKTGP